MTARAPIALAADTQDLETLHSWVVQTADTVSTIKVGLELFLRHGGNAVAAVRAAAGTDGPDLFLDLKLHDIPNTVAGAAAAIADFEPAYVTVHATGGQAMIEAAARALPRSRVTAVTVLTSMSGEDLNAVGLVGPAQEAAVRLAVLAVDAGARAVVCSPQEVAAVRAAVPRDVHLITPGVRPAGSDVGDQRRTTTPAEAIAFGSDLLVIGRPITGAPDPGAAASMIAAQLNETPTGGLL